IEAIVTRGGNPFFKVINVHSGSLCDCRPLHDGDRPQRTTNREDLPYCDVIFAFLVFACSSIAYWTPVGHDCQN
ncbi:MAG: hypothetical protein WBQ55_26820, partial [Xanthobacteraceae bacterium]